MSHMITEAQESMDRRQEARRETRNKGQQNLLIPLSFVDDCNSIRVGDKKSMDLCFEELATRWGMEWEKGKQ